MAGYKTRKSWSAPDIQFDSNGRRIRPEAVPTFEGSGAEVCLQSTDRCAYAGPLGLDACGQLCALRHPATALCSLCNGSGLVSLGKGVRGITRCPLKDSGERQAFSTGAQRDAQSGKGRYDLLPVLALRRLAVTFEKGAKKYAARNWEKGIPLSKYMDSAIRHLFKHLEGWTDEDHAAQALWNVACMIQTAEMVERGLLPGELADLPAYLPPGADSWE